MSRSSRTVPALYLNSNVNDNVNGMSSRILDFIMLEIEECIDKKLLLIDKPGRECRMNLEV